VKTVGQRGPGGGVDGRVQERQKKDGKVLRTGYAGGRGVAADPEILVIPAPIDAEHPQHFDERTSQPPHSTDSTPVKSSQIL
jgi:hypothetical protein